MWVMMNDAFVSLVIDRRDPNFILARARRRGDLERVFHGVRAGFPRVEETPDADYRYRASIHRATVKVALARQVGLIDYDNFKNSVVDTRLHDVYSRCWGLLRELQRVTPLFGNRRSFKARLSARTKVSG